jgi:hypothetical protein
MKSTSVEYEVIGRAVVTGFAGDVQHSLKLLYRGDGTPWWTCSAGLEMRVPADFEAGPGDKLKLTIEKIDPPSAPS